jgi:hypothetical protein
MHGEVYFSKKIELNRKRHSVKRNKLKESDFLFLFTTPKKKITNMNTTQAATQIDWQFLFNVAFMIVGFLATWVFKRAFNMIDKQEDKTSALESKIHAIEVSLPKEYVNKEDLNKFSEQINTRFDKLEVKLDNIIERSK